MLIQNGQVLTFTAKLIRVIEDILQNSRTSVLSIRLTVGVKGFKSSPPGGELLNPYNLKGISPAKARVP